MPNLGQAQVMSGPGRRLTRQGVGVHQVRLYLTQCPCEIAAAPSIINKVPDKMHGAIGAENILMRNDPHGTTLSGQALDKGPIAPNQDMNRIAPCKQGLNNHLPTDRGAPEHGAELCKNDA
jgi:hypothetical protein